MARAPTTFSRLSTGYKDSKNTIAESGYDFSAIDAYYEGVVVGASTASYGGQLTAKGIRSTSNNTFTSNTTIGAGLTVDSNVTFNSGLTTKGQATFVSLLVQSIATLLSNVSVGGGLTVRSNATFQASNVTVSGGLTVDSGATFNSGLSTKGQLTGQSLLAQSLATFNAGIAVGTGGLMTAFSTATAAVSLGAIAPNESSSVQTVGLSGVTRGDTLILTLDSIYQDIAANRDVVWLASSSSTLGEANVWGINSTLTSVTPTAATIVRLTRIAHPTYL